MSESVLTGNERPGSGRERSHATNRSFDPTLLVTTVIATVVVVYKTLSQIVIGPGWDSFAFLANAAHMAGKGIGYTEPHRPPFLSFVTSLLFRVVPPHAVGLQWIDAVFTVFGIVGFYLLLRRRFNGGTSMLGALALLAVPPLLLFTGTGYTDFPSVALVIWTLLAAMWATERSPNWYLLAFPLFVLAVLTRYGSLITLFPLGLWLLFRAIPFRHAKPIVSGAAIAVLVFIPAGRYFHARFGDALYPLLRTTEVAENADLQAAGGVREQLAHGYLVELPKLLAAPQLQLLLIGVLFVVAASLAVSAVNRVRSSQKTLGPRLICAGLVAVAVLAQFGAGLLVRQATITLAILAVWRVFAPRGTGQPPMDRTLPENAMDAVMLSLLLSFLDAHGHMAVQIPRYFITMAPAFVYFILLGLQHFARRLTVALQGGMIDATRDASLRPKEARVVWVVLAGVIAGSFALQFANANVVRDPTVSGLEQAATWVRLNVDESDYSSVHSDLWPVSNWYLPPGVVPRPYFQKSVTMRHELEKDGVEYFVTSAARHIPGYTRVMSSDEVVVLRRADTPSEAKPRVFYVGKGWENYLESLTDYTVDLVYPYTSEYLGSNSDVQRAMYVDTYSAEELSRYDVVAVSGFRWRDRNAAERVLQEYVRGGGTLVLDASTNMGGVSSSLVGTIFLGTYIERRQVDAAADMRVDGELSSRHSIGVDPQTAPFVGEDGSGWFGATYASVNPADERSSLVWIAGRPSVSVQRIGRGKVYWIGDNLVWHAFIGKSRDEARVVTAVLEEAIGTSSSPQEDAR